MDSTPSLFPLSEGQLEENLVECKYVTNCLQNQNKIDDVTTDFLYLRHSLFQDQSPLFDQILQFELKFRGDVNSNFIFRVNFVKQIEFGKNYGVLCHFLQKCVSKICELTFEIVAVTRPCIRFFSFR